MLASPPIPDPPLSSSFRRRTVHASGPCRPRYRPPCPAPTLVLPFFVSRGYLYGIERYRSFFGVGLSVYSHSSARRGVLILCSGLLYGIRRGRSARRSVGYSSAFTADEAIYCILHGNFWQTPGWVFMGTLTFMICMTNDKLLHR